MVVPQTAVRLNFEGAPWLLKLWYGSVTAFAIPLSIAVLRFTKSTALLFASAIWGAWLLGLSFAVTIGVFFSIPEAPYNTLAMCFVMLFALSLGLFSYLEWNSLREKPAKKVEEKIAPEPAPSEIVEGATAAPAVAASEHSA